ncbi:MULTISPECIES: ParB/RepB/Spo0J family partition protein [unclassified Oleiphilus]|nr:MULTISPECIES: ParB/RepB/Spo0J family partition protein [unclassified Oleiphilus]KZY84256.1 chromosome partitioning protein ParB [Oleiphilus sp. HI0068]KZY87302.1 chromosome partitioning protein ParB [Oleiphilus sp. HI0069]KZY95453.1 chromosome partitioning protein ParB [Oleiphilus sp. HI0072]KZZ08505.1 chromosome partitioning protein ParB [Oleiphilus sp. HI0078]KZZ19485.1 chromosome partitioning protein ParB [Oleiphilus sp. HI0081]KZZ32689.1 chromosome partitioning protein ParB [Oleiphilus
MAKKRGLGEKGLSALLKGSNVDFKKEVENDGDLKQLPVEFLKRGKYQPRRDMDPDALEELAESIRQQGIMQPIVVRSRGEDSYEIIAGERRWRAAQIAQLDKVPAIIRDVEDDAAVAMALIENIQRENLNAMEEATALQRLQDEFELTQSEVAEAVGKSRSTVTNLLRLINLTDEVKLMLEHGDLEMGHGRAMLSLDTERQIIVARQVELKSLSVRQTEALVRRLIEDKPTNKAAKPKPDADISRLQEDLSEKVGAEVSVQHSNTGKGKLVIKYNSLDELDGILTHIK